MMVAKTLLLQCHGIAKFWSLLDVSSRRRNLTKNIKVAKSRLCFNFVSLSNPIVEVFREDLPLCRCKTWFAFGFLFPNTGLYIDKKFSEAQFSISFSQKKLSKSIDIEINYTKS